MPGSSTSKVISPHEPATQLKAEDSPFSAVILCDEDNERYYALAYESAKAQNLPFKAIYRAKLSGRMIDEWCKLVDKLKTAWVIYFYADVTLLPTATLRIYPFLVDPSIGSFRVTATNRLLGKTFVNVFGSPDIGVCNVAALREALPSAAPAFDPQLAIAKNGYQTVLLRSRLRTDTGQPGSAGENVTRVIALGENIADWRPLYAYRWCRIFGAHARTFGGTDYSVLATSMIAENHPLWQLGLAAFVTGILSHDGPDVRERRGIIRSEFERAKFLVKEA